MSSTSPALTAVPADDLLAMTAAMVAIPSVSLDEHALANAIADLLHAVAPRLELTRIGDNLVVRTQCGAPTRVLLGGHLDTVPPSNNADPHRDGDALYGVGSADMKGGLAVLCRLAVALNAALDAGTLACDVTLVFYVGEEVAAQHNGLLAIEDHDVGLLDADFAVLLEPTEGWMEAGCQGNCTVEFTVHGTRAHSARPWKGENALVKALPLLERIAAFDPGTLRIDGLDYRQSCQIVRVDAGVADNVVPDRCTVVVNRRFAPSLALDDVVAELAAVAGQSLDVRSASLGALPNLTHPLVVEFLAATGAPVRSKLGWTDVARFTARGLPACNYGPGDPARAHGPNECVTGAQLDAVYAGLARLVGVSA